MPHHSPLVSTIVVGLVLAFAFGAVAHRFKLSPLVGYLLAGVVIGPFTPGFIADQSVANELADIGIILLMFGVGLQFSLEELLSVRAIAVPGAIAQIAVATALGVGLSHLLGWPLARMGSHHAVARGMSIIVGCMSTALGIYYGSRILGF